MTSPKRQKASRTTPSRAKDTAPAILPTDVVAAPAPAAIPLPTGRRLMLAKRHSEPPPAPAPAPEAAPESGTLASVRGASMSTNGDERQQLVARVAYHRAERLGFGRTDPVEDWLWAEREVARMLAEQSAA